MLRGAFRANCELCQGELDTREDGVHQWTAGWVMQREGGGGHAIACPQRMERWAHHHCVVNAARGFTRQGSLFK